ncbi:hypothetical protein SAMN06269117_1385, partial [Balnearium lithotrophicum]
PHQGLGYKTPVEKFEEYIKKLQGVHHVLNENISLSKNKANLFLVGVKYFINDQLSLNGGWVYERKKLKDINDINLDLSTKGYFLGVELVW